MEKFLDHPRAPFKTNHRQIERPFFLIFTSFFYLAENKSQNFFVVDSY